MKRLTKCAIPTGRSRRWPTQSKQDLRVARTACSPPSAGSRDPRVRPTWSTDGKSLLYVSRDALWLSPATGGNPTEIATPLFAPAEWLHPRFGVISYYGQINWTGQFNWRSP
jgi:hypothetical protein